MISFSESFGVSSEEDSVSVSELSSWFTEAISVSIFTISASWFFAISWLKIFSETSFFSDSSVSSIFGRGVSFLTSRSFFFSAWEVLIDPRERRVDPVSIVFSSWAVFSCISGFSTDVAAVAQVFSTEAAVSVCSVTCFLGLFTLAQRLIATVLSFFKAFRSSFFSIFFVFIYYFYSYTIIIYFKI